MNQNTSEPQALYKYKCISGNSLDYFLDVIYNHRLFAPKVSDLNDPFEGFQLLPAGMQYAGISYYSGTPIPYSVMQGELERYRVISLTENLDNPLMWIHYADNFTGACIGFHKNPVFNDAFKISYYKNLTKHTYQDVESAKKLFRDGLSQKWIGWDYEKEWRYILETDHTFLEFDKKQISKICLGYKMKPNIRKAISFICKNEGYSVSIAYVDPYSCNVEIIDSDEYENRIKKLRLNI